MIENFFLVIFWIIIGLYLIQMVFRYLVPWFIRRFIKKMHRQMQKQSRQDFTGKSNKKVTIQYERNNESTIDPEIGEYVDFEEIKNNENTKNHE